MSQQQTILSLKNVSKKFGEFVALRDISFDIQQGEMIAIIGPNGSGKTTLGKIIIGLEERTSGDIIFSDKRILRSIGYVPQRFDFDRSIPMTVKEFLDLQSCDASAHTCNNAVVQALSLVGMEDHINRQLGVLSGGQLQRVLIARAIMHQKKILLLDEPNAHIDREGEKAMYDVLKQINTVHKHYNDCDFS